MNNQYVIDAAIIWIKYTPHLLYSLRVQDFTVQVDKQQKTPLPSISTGLGGIRVLKGHLKPD